MTIDLGSLEVIFPASTIEHDGHGRHGRMVA